MIDYRLLGPLEVAVNGHAVDVGGLKQRALLAILLLHANQPVDRDVLIDQLWAEHPPARAEHAVEVAPWVPLYNPRNLNLLSTRVGNYQFHPYFDLLLDQLWAR